MILTTDKLSMVIKEFEALPENALVVFDVDDVLFQPSDQILRSHSFKEVKIFENIIDKNYDKKTADELYSIIWLQRKIEIVEKEMVYLIRSLQEKRLPVLALTNCMIGSFGQIKSVEEWRIRELKSCDYHFDKSWQNFDEKIFQHTDKDIIENNSCFKNGIIFTNNVDKGKSLEKFLEYFNIKPNHIIFTDDLSKNLVSVQKTCKKLGIGFTGIEYRAASASSKKPLNLDIAMRQVHVLEKEYKWISDNEANQLQTNKDI